MIHVIATLETIAGGRERLVALFREVTPLVLKEDGCIEYGAAVDQATDIAGLAEPRDNAVTVVEKWESPAALDAHLKAPHMAEFREKTKPLLANVEIRVLQPA